MDTFVPEIAAPLSTANGVNANSGGRRQEDDVNVVAETLRSHPRPGSNTNGAIVTVCLGSDPISTEDLAQPVTCRNGDPGVVAYPIAIRDRDHGAVAEVGEEGIYNALRAGDGGSSRQQLLMHSVRPEVVATVSAWQMRNSQGSNQFGVKVGEEVTDTLDTAGAPGVAYNPYRTLEKDGSITSGFGEKSVVDALHGPTGNKEPLIVSAAYPLALRGRGDGADLEMGEEGTYNTLRAGRGGASEANLVAAFSENQRGEVLETDYARQVTTGGGKPGQGYPAVRQDMAVRRLTPMECERLQGFPDEWTGGFVDSTRYRMLGNAVCVSVARWIGERLMAVTHGRH